ncbi:hypothetical protein NDK47_16620 [Brevibacillus ruminantium]|uniref:Uncharacterized protein n=1 Tax=Brevibacillus ruminantium TaxID=2950604 RepID=A0ABY4WGK8_9BACL|nr:hypothetical protein [Brevibacillus ruminantium]USG63791.1 hypothetical protein NDK47_16620 [Brevibacillus ruminantium]
MDIHKHDELLTTLQKQFAEGQIAVQFTQWDGEGDDEEVTEFRGTLVEWKLSDNDFGEKDLFILFRLKSEDDIELLMEIPAEEENLAEWNEGRLTIFGTEAELILTK